MATSGSVNFNVTANDIITESLGLVGVYTPGETLDSTETADALRSLNMMLKAWQPKVGLWLHRDLSLFLQDDTVKYSIGPTGTHCSSNTVVKTEVATAAAAAATSVVVDSYTGIGNTFDVDGILASSTPAAAGALTLDGALVTNGIATLSSQRKILIYSDGDESGDTYAVVGQDAAGVAVTESITGPNATTVYSTSTFKTISSITISGAATGNVSIGQVGDHIGIELTSGSMQWNNISAAVSSTTLSVVTALSGAVAVDNHVYTYTEKTPRPIEIIEARLYKNSDYEVPLGLGGRQDYKMLSNKTTEGTPNQLYYDKQLTNGVMFVWPEPNSMKEYIKFTAKIPIQDVDSLTNDFEVAQEWYEAIAWNLAVRLFPKYGKLIDPMVRDVADDMLDDAMTSDSENASTFIQVASSRHV